MVGFRVLFAEPGIWLQRDSPPVLHELPCHLPCAEGHGDLVPWGSLAMNPPAADEGDADQFGPACTGDPS